MNTENREVTQDELEFLWRRGFIWGGEWIFNKNGKLYDLSAADLTQIDRIELLGLFLVDES